MKSKIISKRATAKVKGYKEWLKANRMLSTADIMKITITKLQNNYECYIRLM